MFSTRYGGIQPGEMHTNSCCSCATAFSAKTINTGGTAPNAICHSKELPSIGSNWITGKEFDWEGSSQVYIRNSSCCISFQELPYQGWEGTRGKTMCQGTSIPWSKQQNGACESGNRCYRYNKCIFFRLFTTVIYKCCSNLWKLKL